MRADGTLAREAHDAAASALGLSDSDKQELLPSGLQPVYKNRAGWAHDRHKRAGLSASARRGFWQLTPEGLAFAAQNPQPLSVEVLGELATGHNDVRLRNAESDGEVRDVPRSEVPSLTALTPQNGLHSHPCFQCDGPVACNRSDCRETVSEHRHCHEGYTPSQWANYLRNNGDGWQLS